MPSLISRFNVNNLGIGAKIGVIMALMLLPLGLMVWLFIAQAQKDGVPDSWIEAAQRSPVYKMANEWKVAFPLHPESVIERLMESVKS